MYYKINDNIKVSDIGFMGLETWIGKVVGVNYVNYIIDLGEDTVGCQRFLTRNKKDYIDLPDITPNHNSD